MHIKIKFIIVLCFFTLSNFSQEVNVKKTYRNAQFYLNSNDYNKALENFLILYNADPANSNFSYQVARCYFNITSERMKAMPYLHRSKGNVSKAYKEGDEAVSAGIETLFMLGELHHFSDDLDSGFYYYKEYEAIATEKEDQDKVANRIKNIRVARKLQETYLPYAAENLGDVVNTEFSDYNPVFSSDEQVIAYTSYQNGFDEIFISRKVNGKWSTPINISKELGSNGSCFTSALSADGSILYLIRIDEFGSDIFYAENDGKKWSKMKPFDSRINSIYFETSFFINDSGTEIYFSSDAPEGFGGIDLYYSTLDEKGRWKNPVNMGSRINTPFDEEYPYLALDGNLLFFSSNGHETMGGFDLFFTEKIDNDVWSKPVNIGYPVNTPDNDLSYVAHGKGNTGFIVKDLPGGYGLMDIYNISIPYDLMFADKMLDLPKGQFVATNVIEPLEEPVEEEPKANLNEAVLTTNEKELTIEPVQQTIRTEIETTPVPDVQESIEAVVAEPLMAEVLDETVSEEDEPVIEETIPLVSEENGQAPQADNEHIAEPDLKQEEKEDVPEYTQELVSESLITEVSDETTTKDESVIEEPILHVLKETEQLPQAETEQGTATYLEQEDIAQQNVVEELVVEEVLAEPEQFSTEIKEEVVEEPKMIVEEEVINEESIINYGTTQSQPLIQEQIKNTPYSEREKILVIQIIALKNPVPAKDFYGVGVVKRSDGDDEYARYTVGYFDNVDDARTEMFRIKDLGYPNAFLRRVSSVSNYFDGH